MERDFLDEIIAKRAERNPEIPKLVDAALERRQERRQKSAPMGTAHVDHTPPSSSTPHRSPVGKKDELAAV
jgi:hypothetical protein